MFITYVEYNSLYKFPICLHIIYSTGIYICKYMSIYFHFSLTLKLRNVLFY